MCNVPTTIQRIKQYHKYQSKGYEQILTLIYKLIVKNYSDTDSFQ